VSWDILDKAGDEGWGSLEALLVRAKNLHFRECSFVDAAFEPCTTEETTGAERCQ